MTLLEYVKHIIHSTKEGAPRLSEFNDRVCGRVDQLLQKQKDISTDPEKSDQEVEEALTKMRTLVYCLRGIKKAIKEHQVAEEAKLAAFSKGKCSLRTLMS